MPSETYILCTTYRHELAKQDPDSLMRMAAGDEVGALARELSPELSTEEALDLTDAAIGKSPAQEAYKKLVSDEMDKEARQGIRQELLKYCEQDTWAMVEIVKRYRK